MIEALVKHFTNGNKSKFALMLGVTPQTINTWESRNTFDAELIYAKCECVSGDWLLTGEGSMLKTAPPPETPETTSEPQPNDIIIPLLNRLEALSRENERLKIENQSLIHRLAQNEA